MGAIKNAWRGAQLIGGMMLLGVTIIGTAADLTGIPRILDGDTVEINGVKIRLEGIDAPETDQLCLDVNGHRWTCGIDARDQLIAKGGGKSWTCRVSSSDRYGRSLAICNVDGEDVGRWLVRAGWALSFTRYSHVYDPDEKAARDAGAGLWSGAFIAPWDWRNRSKATPILGKASVPMNAQKLLLSPASADEAPSPDCVIKGNVNRQGECIYHLPGGRSYSLINMHLRGKRWFCTEAEAEAAGCRKAMR
jgi:endonuclease YncB( thermonuclease family)